MAVCIIVYVCETWTLLVDEGKRIPAFEKNTEKAFAYVLLVAQNQLLCAQYRQMSEHRIV